LHSPASGDPEISHKYSLWLAQATSGFAAICMASVGSIRCEGAQQRGQFAVGTYLLAVL
jgi:hypothetical protein